MRNRIFAIIVSCCITACLSSVHALGSGSKGVGDIMLKNGQKLASINFELPFEYDK